MKMGNFQEKLKQRIQSGLVFTTASLGYEYLVEGYLRKYAGKYADPVGMGVAVGLDALGISDKMKNAEAVVNDLIDALSDYSMYRTAKTLAVKPPMCYFKDANTIVALNLKPSAVDSTKIKVFIDGTEVTVSGVSGTVDELTISLSNPVASGQHELTITSDTGKACYNKWARV